MCRICRDYQYTKAGPTCCETDDFSSSQEELEEGSINMKYQCVACRQEKWKSVKDDMDLNVLLGEVHHSHGSQDPLLGDHHGYTNSHYSSSPDLARDRRGRMSPQDNNEDLLVLGCIPRLRKTTQSYSIDTTNCSNHTGQDHASHMPKSISMSLPVQRALPDPFPELASSPATPVMELKSEASHSSPSSPLVRRSHRVGSSSSPGRSPTLPEGVSADYAYQCLRDSPCGSPHGSPRISPHGSPRGSPGGGRNSPRDHRDIFTYSQDSLNHLDTLEPGGGWTASVYTKTMINFHNDDDRSCRAVSVDEHMLASDVCHLLVLRNHSVQDKNWVILEHISKFDLERSLEDHESLYSIYRSWGNSEANKFYFRKDFRKYEFYVDPTQFFPSNMLNIPIKDDGSVGLLTDRAQRQRNILLQNLLSSCSSLPDIQGYLTMREGKRSWKKHFFVLRKSGLYYSTKGSSKDPRYLVLFCGLKDVNIYTANNAKKNLGAPNNYCFCLKPLYSVTDVKDLKLLCAEDEQSRLCWVTGLRLVKYGSQLLENFKSALRYEEKLQSIENTSSQKPSDSSSFCPKSRVAMDFSGNAGRVVDDPNEALGVAVEEAHQWRKKVACRPAKSPLSQSPVLPTSIVSENSAISSHGISSGVHFLQPWFHSGISRAEVVNLIQQAGLVDGVFLLRESHSSQDTYVLSMAHNQKVKHCQIIKIDEDGIVVYSLDRGRTKFTDLIQLVEFYQVNAGGLPCRLTHYVTKLAG